MLLRTQPTRRTLIPAIVAGLYLLLFTAAPGFCSEEKFAVASDFHVTTDGSNLLKIATAAHLRGATTLLALGDLVDDGNMNSAWQLWTDAVNRSLIPVVTVPGNHDFATGLATNSQLSMTTHVHTWYQGIQVPRVVRFGNVSAHAICCTWPEWYGHQESLNWLSGELSQTKREANPFIVINHFYIDEATQPLVEGASKPILWLSGHQHAWISRPIGRSWNLGSPAWAKGFWLITLDGSRVRAEKCTATGATFESYDLTLGGEPLAWSCVTGSIPPEASRPPTPLPDQALAIAAPRTIQMRESDIRSGFSLPDLAGSRYRITTAPTRGVLRGVIPHLRYLAAPYAQGTDSFTCVDAVNAETLKVDIEIAPQTDPYLESIWAYDDFVAPEGSLLDERRNGEGWGEHWNASKGAISDITFLRLGQKITRKSCTDPHGSRILKKRLDLEASDVWIALAFRETSARSLGKIQLRHQDLTGATLHLDATHPTWQIDVAGIPLPEPTDQPGDGSDSDTWIPRDQKSRLWLIQLHHEGATCRVALWHDPDLYSPPGYGALSYSLPTFKLDTIALSCSDMAIDSLVVGATAAAVTRAALQPESH